MMRVHSWSGLGSTSSNGSFTAGNDPPAVRGPFDAENSVDTRSFVPLHTRTSPAVAAIAALVRACSTGVNPELVAPPRVAAPK